MSHSAIIATVVFALFALLFFGVLLTAAAVMDKRRVQEVHDAIPERSEGADPTEVRGQVVERPDERQRGSRRS